MIFLPMCLKSPSSGELNLINVDLLLPCGQKWLFNDLQWTLKTLNSHCQSMKIIKVDLIYMLTTPQQRGRCGTNIHVWYIRNTQDVTLALLSSHWSPAPMSLISAAALYLVINSLPPLTPTDCSTLLLNAKTLQIYLGLVCTQYMQQKTWKAKRLSSQMLKT